MEHFQQTTQQDTTAPEQMNTHIELPESSLSSISWNDLFTSDRERSVRAIYGRMPIFDSGETPVVEGTFQGGENLKNVIHDSGVSGPLLPGEFARLPQEILRSTRGPAMQIGDSRESVPSGEDLSTMKTTTLAHGGKDLSWNWKTRSLGELFRCYNELTSSNLGSLYDEDGSPQDSYSEDIANFYQSTWLTSGEVSAIPRRSSPATPLESQSGSSVRCGRTVGISADGNIKPQDGETEKNNGSRPRETASSLLENDCPIPVFRFSRNSHDPGNSFRSSEINSGTPRIYPFPFPPTEEVPTTPLHGEIPPESLVFMQDPQYVDRPEGVNLGYQFPQIPRNNPILPYLQVGPLCPATGRPPIPNLVETTQVTSGSREDMNVPRSWWHYFYRSVVPSYLFKNDRQPSLNLPELDHWSIEVESPDTRPPSLMKVTYQERQEKRLKRAICTRWIKFQLEKIRNFVVTGPKMAAAVVLWVFRWCGLDKSSAGWYG